MNQRKPSTDERSRELAQAQTLTSLLCLLLTVSLIFATIGIPLTQVAFAAGGQVSLWKTGNIDYTGGSWNAHIFMTDDGNGPAVAYCVEPEKNSPPEGSYAKSSISCKSGRNLELRADLWFAYGGPGFDKSMWPSKNWNGAPMSDEDYYLASHILVSDTYSSSGYTATHGASESFRNWLAWNIIGFDINTGAVSNPNAVGRLAIMRSGEVPANFEAFQINGGSVQTIATFSAYKPYGTLKLSKQSANPNVTDGNPLYSMKGICYGVYTTQSCNAASDTGLRLELDENGNAQISEILAGTYYVREIESSVKGTGYAYDATVHPCTVNSGETSWVHDAASGASTVSDRPITRPAQALLQKHDILTRSVIPSGDADLSNAFFEVSYFANLQGDASGTPVRTWVFKTDQEGKIDLRDGAHDAFVSGDNLYYTATGQHAAFPLGTYSIKELTAPASYDPPLATKPIVLTLNATGTGEFDATSDDLPDGGIRFDEVPVRHDLSFTKRDMDTQRPMENIPFLVTRMTADGTIIERHVAVTDGNGMFSSNADRALHTTKTNKNDEALVDHGNGRFSIKEDRLDPDCGIWFGVAKDGSWTSPDNDFGAFPDSATSKYVFEELPVKANEGKALVRFEAYSHAARATTIDLGTVGNTTPTVATIARDAVDGDKLISKTSDAAIIDSVSYTGLVAGNSYELRATLLSASSGMPVTGDNGEAIEEALSFTATASSGTLEIGLCFDATAMPAGEKLVVGEELFEADRLLATHWDVLDSAQTVTVNEPIIQTRAADQKDGDSIIIKDRAATVLDMVSYAGLVPGKEYVLTGTIIDRATKAPVEVNGSAVISTTSFIAEAATGSVDVSFVFNASELPVGTELVVFERLSCDGETIAVHKDPDDAYQTLIVAAPRLETTASDPHDRDSVIAADIESQLVDSVRFQGLTPGLTYTLEATLVDKDTGRPLLDPFEKHVRTTHEFTPIASDGTTDVLFTFDASNIAEAQAAVVFEELYGDGKLLASHIDLESASQSIVIEPPSIQTFASADGTSKSIMRDQGVSLIDAVSYQNLQPGKDYLLEGTLMRQATGETLLDAEHHPIVSSLSFTADQTSGLVQLPFELDASDFEEGDTIVVFEKLYRDGVQVATHEDLESERQTIVVAKPTIVTSARSVDGTKTVVRDRTSTVIDHVNYTGLAPHCTYELVGSLMNATTGEPLQDAQGVEVTAHASFVPKQTDGELSLSFEFDASSLSDDQHLVVFEHLYRNEALIASHADPLDENQTVTIVPVAIATHASDPADGDKVVAAHPNTRIVDAITYRGLEPGADYELVGYLMDADEQMTLLTAQGNPAQASRSFTAQAVDGNVNVDFHFDASSVSEQRNVVIFEELYRDGTLIATHADYDNEAQTVSVEPAMIDTCAADGSDGDKELARRGTQSIVDTISYTGLIPGKEYEVRGKLMINDGTLEGTPLLDAFGSPCETRLSFTPSATHGNVDVSFDVDTVPLDEGTRIVALESLYCDQALVAQHEDLRDDDQTVRVEKSKIVPDKPLTFTMDKGSQVNTGDRAALLLGASALIGLCSLGILSILRRKAFGEMHLKE